MEDKRRRYSVGRKACRLLQKAWSEVVYGRPLYQTYDHPTIDWMIFGHASPESGPSREKHFLFKLILENLPSTNPLLEIGVFAGRSTNVICFLKSLLQVENSLITTDPWLVCDKDVSPTILADDYRSHIRRQFEANVRFWSSVCLPFSFALSSDEFFELWHASQEHTTVWGDARRLGGPLAAVFLDGDHGKEQVRRDFANIDRALESKGLIYFDDSDALHRNCGEIGNAVYDLVQDLLREGRYRLFAKNPNYVLQKIE